MELSDFFDEDSGLAPALRRSSIPRRKALDVLYNASLALSTERRRVRRDEAVGRRQRVLLVGVEVPSRPADIHALVGRMKDGSRHDLTVSITPMGDRGKFANLDEAIRMAPEPLDSFDWLIATDDDISFAPGFLDDLVAFATAGDLSMAQPAHAFESHTSYAITRRQWGALVRRTGFVEIGPLTLIRADAFETFIPFPDSRWCYGIDILWSELAETKGHRMGIIDATPVRHLRPIGASYGMEQAVEEGRALLRRFNVRRRRDQLWESQIVVPV